MAAVVGAVRAERSRRVALRISERLALPPVRVGQLISVLGALLLQRMFVVGELRVREVGDPYVRLANSLELPGAPGLRGKLGGRADERAGALAGGRPTIGGGRNPVGSTPPWVSVERPRDG